MLSTPQRRTASLVRPWSRRVTVCGGTLLAAVLIGGLVLASGRLRQHGSIVAGTVTTLLGDAETLAYDFGDRGEVLPLNYPHGVAVDQHGTAYIADRGNNRIRKIAPDGTVSNVALPFAPRQLAVDAAGNVYTFGYRDRLMKLTTDGAVVTLAGAGTEGFADGPGATAQFGFQPEGLAVDAAGSVYVADTANNRIRRVAPDGTVTTLAGSGQGGYVDGPAATAQFKFPFGLAVDGGGNVYAADVGNKAVRKLTPDGTVSTLYRASNPPRYLAVDASGRLYVANPDALRRVTPGGSTATLADLRRQGYVDGPSATTRWGDVWAIAVDASGSVYVLDTRFVRGGRNEHLRKITPAP